MLRVIEPGLMTTVQDLGRPHAAASGVSPGGAMDRFAHRAANLLVGNDPGSATLECTISGPQLAAGQPCLISVAGADMQPRVNGRPVEPWSGILLGQGDTLTFGPRKLGARAYIAVAGGIHAERWLGSQSTNLVAGRGGMQGRPLRAGDVVETALPQQRSAAPRLDPELLPAYDDHQLPVIAGPHVDRLNPAARKALFDSTFTVSHRADRMGYRLDGPALEIAGEELLSFGLVTGAVQLPRGGSPILLMADHQTAGGYPVVATVISAALPIAAQLAPGDELRFIEVTVERAAELRHAQAAALASLRA